MKKEVYLFLKELENNREDNIQNEALYFTRVSSSICKISTSTQIGTGFLLKYLLEDNILYFLISNEHVINNDMIKTKDILHILYDNELKNAVIKLDEKERYIKIFKDIDLDITIVEILPKDNIEIYYFLRPELDNNDNNKLINSQIYIPNYPFGEKLTNSEGTIEKINKNELIYSTKTKEISSGSPIFLKESTKVIGIHKLCNKNKNYGDFIYPIFNKIKNEIKIKAVENNKNKKIEYENGDYYIGEIENDKPHGKGIKII